jgi:hypothetical protein
MEVNSERLRIAIVSTPRSGNCWLRHMLARVLDLHEMGVDQAAPPEQGLDWESLPDRVIVPMHWLPEAGFRSRLEQHGFRPIVIARHPLDVLLSVLAFSQHDVSTQFWLAGAGGDERSIQGASPMSEAFLTYATGPRSAALLSISAAWWQAPDACRVRYEDLIHDTCGQIEQILTTLGVPARRPLSEVVENSSPEAMRALQVEWLYHIWQRQPGSWKRLLTPTAARRICDFHHVVMNGYGYACDADESLDAAAAQMIWEQMDAAVLRRNVNGVKKVLAESETRRLSDRAQLGADLHSLATQTQSLATQMNSLSAQVQPLSAELQQVAALTAALHQAKAQHELASLTRQFESLPLRQIRELEELGPWSFGVARRLHRWSNRFPRTARSFKSLVTFARSLKAPTQ